jgi:polysaccharide export outer membrane protein
MKKIRALFSCFLFSVVMMFSSTSIIASQYSSLSAGDVLKITVYGQPDLTTVARIGGDEKITFPLIGDVKIGGLTTAQAESSIASQLQKRGYVKNAQVSIFIEQRRRTMTNSVTILGQIARAGKYPVQQASEEGVQTLVDLLAVAGGTKDHAADHLLLMKKEGKGQKKIQVDLVALLREGDLKHNHVLNGGDIILVPEMDVFYIYGQVQRPGRYRLERGMTVMQAISVASGITDRGSESSVSLKRSSNGDVKSSSAKLTDVLQADDVIYVKESLF